MSEVTGETIAEILAAFQRSELLNQLARVLGRNLTVQEITETDAFVASLRAVREREDRLADTDESNG